MTYTPPSSSDLIARYPAFALVPTDAIDYWLSQAQAEIGDSWSDNDRANAQMAWAAARMADIGVQGLAGSSAGVSSFRSGSFSATVSDVVAARTGFEATVYGRDYLQLRRRNFAGPQVIGYNGPPTC